MGSRVRHYRQQLGLACATVLCALLSGTVSGNGGPDLVKTGPPSPEFQFARLAYSDSGFGGMGRGGRSGSWSTDAPDAEYHLLTGMRRLTRINALDLTRASSVGCEPIEPPLVKFIACTPTDPGLFDFPFLYGVEVGRWFLNEEDAANLLEYLLRGGFLMVDDFHGSAQWEGFMDSLRKVFPDREVIDIPENHEVFHVLYDLNQRQQIPGIFPLMNGTTYEQDGVEPYWRGVFDDNGRLMVMINHNMDLGDAWEHADDPEYPQPLTAMAYRFAISYALYAMSH